MIVDSKSLGQSGTQCGENGKKRDILFAFVSVFDNTFVYQVGQISVQFAIEYRCDFSEFFADPIGFTCVVCVFWSTIVSFCPFVLLTGCI